MEKDCGEELPLEFECERRWAKHIRKRHGVDVRRTPGFIDRHNHMWYCFDCQGKGGKDHRSFDCDTGVIDHLRDAHGVCADHRYRRKKEAPQ